MTVLITGGAGYIGSHTARHLHRRGTDVVILDSLERGYRQAVTGLALVVGDIADADLVADTCRRYAVDAVVHFAAYKFVGESMQRPERYWANNVAGTVALTHALQEAGVHDIVFSSSCSVYGTPSAVPVNEGAPISPESVYAESKSIIEKVLQWQTRLTDTRAVSLRYFNASGAHPDGDIGEVWDQAQNLVPLIMKAALGRADRLLIHGNDYPTPDGTGVRDYVHVCDLAAAHAAALDYLARGGTRPAFNVGTGRGNSVLEVLASTERVSGRSIAHEFAPRRAGDIAAVWSDTALAATELGWTAKLGLDEIIETAWRWHSQHPDGYTA